jgi:gamma-glutamyltranspeptidase/glutathione hydrolase
MSAGEIVADPRYHHQYLPDVVEYEKGAFTESEITRLQAMGHKLEEGSRRWGNMEVITWDFASGTVDAASDPRGAGAGLVY